jgi:hypothetical protein
MRDEFEVRKDEGETRCEHQSNIIEKHQGGRQV